MKVSIDYEEYKRLKQKSFLVDEATKKIKELEGKIEELENDLDWAEEVIWMNNETFWDLEHEED